MATLTDVQFKDGELADGIVSGMQVRGAILANEMKERGATQSELEEVKLASIKNDRDVLNLYSRKYSNFFDLDRNKESDTRKDILEKAMECVCGQREQDYGSPESNFQTIADFWNTYLGYTHLTATDVSMMMALLKIARIKNGGGTGDSFVDLAGYAACGGELNKKERENK